MKLQIVLAVGLLACGGKTDEPAGGDKTASGKPVEAKPAASSGPFADFGSTDAILNKFQGAWVLESGSLGHYEAWEVNGNKVTSWDGKKEQTRELVIDAPCAARVVEKRNGSSSSSGMTFVFDGDKLHTGMGDAGLKKGDQILACGSGKIFVFDGKKCVAHAEMFGKWESEPTECKLEGTKFTAKRPGMNMSSEFEIAGELLLDQQMKGNKVEKAASFAEAKTKLETIKK